MPIDYSRYPADWKTRIVPAVRERSGDLCEGTRATGFDGPDMRCNAPNMTHIARHEELPWHWIEAERASEAYGRPFLCVLTVAHLDHDEENPDPPLDRLAHLCQRCHLHYDAEEKARRGRVKKDAASGQLPLGLQS